MFENRQEVVTIKEVTPDLIMSINASQQQMGSFGISIEGSKIIFKGKLGKVEGGIGTFHINDTTFDFSKNTSEKQNIIQGEATFGNTKITYGAEIYSDNDDSYKFPNATSISLNYFTPKTKPRPHTRGEYQGSEYFELVIRNKDGTSKTFFLEQNLEVHS